jgi:hypothetical protein
MSLAKFKLKVSGTVAEVLEVNGQDLTGQVRAVRFDGAALDVGRLIVEFVTDDVEIEGEGIVYVQRGDGAAEFLKTVDAQMLEAAVLEKTEWGQSPVETVLAILKELADADPT